MEKICGDGRDLRLPKLEENLSSDELRYHQCSGKLLERVSRWSRKFFSGARAKKIFGSRRVEEVEFSQGSNLLFNRGGEIGGMSLYLAELQNSFLAMEDPLTL